jgi:hypothetical protein
MNPSALSTPPSRPTCSDIPKDYDAAIAWMNRHHAIVMDGGKTYVLIEDLTSRSSVLGSPGRRSRKFASTTTAIESSATGRA